MTDDKITPTAGTVRMAADEHADLVEGLRELGAADWIHPIDAANCDRAADEIERLLLASEGDFAAITALRDDLAKTRNSGSSLDGWIPVDARLPKRLDYVLAWESDGTLHCTVAQHHGSRGVWTGPWGEEIKVTHWQPLPVAPGVVLPMRNEP